jgi:hypothetical protein
VFAKEVVMKIIDFLLWIFIGWPLIGLAYLINFKGGHPLAAGAGFFMGFVILGYLFYG